MDDTSMPLVAQDPVEEFAYEDKPVATGALAQVEVKLEPAPEVVELHPDVAKGYVQPHRDAVVHVVGEKRCPVTILRKDHADFHARQPGVIDQVRCSTCGRDFPASEFVWHGSSERVRAA